MATNSAPSKKWVYASIILITILVFQSVLFIYTYFNIQSQLSDVQTQLQGINQKIQIIEYVNKTQFLPLPKIYEIIKGSVVLITTKVLTQEGLTPYAQGSGFICDRQGHIVTNHHVIEGASEIEVTFIDGNVTTATVVGTDIYSDIAVIRVNRPPEELHPVILGNSSALIVGEPIVAVGNPFGLSDTMTAGIISQLGRELSAPGGYIIIDVIQVDSAINPGNSGGPLVNMNCEVVGVNTAIISGSGTFAGIGFAIPSDTVKRELPSLINTGGYTHPWVGVSGTDVNLEIAQAMGLEKPCGFLIIDIVPDSPADQAGLKGGTKTVTIGGREVKIGGDVIIGIDGLAVWNLNDILVYLERNKRPGDTINLTILRDNKEMNVSLVLGTRPPP